MCFDLPDKSNVLPGIIFALGLMDSMVIVTRAVFQRILKLGLENDIGNRLFGCWSWSHGYGVFRHNTTGTAKFKYYSG